ncbi:Sec-independent protein translocase subunit TatA [Amycolatopsis saalfeldensis]|uniref:Sec-independent protein translocase protein TatA n=1 Tax=Amycolatopsis saalfeldensis TaxID=394193 RepID=A0A1H8SQI5_9PSEU|nr:Sec-independent protein translocase subunit TatA [Amycolatopsis saalfeldensis]SEO80825.1 sec-independent protein translocase protein TatA [Amycolatopsis saalfeldensis]
MNALQPWHIIILVLLVVLLFGAKRLPDTARAIGKSMKIFKAETKDFSGEKSAEDAEPAETRQIPPVAATSTTSGVTSQDDKVADLQRQLEELKKQQAADQPQKNAS